MNTEMQVILTPAHSLTEPLTGNPCGKAGQKDSEMKAALRVSSSISAALPINAAVCSDYKIWL